MPSKFAQCAVIWSCSYIHYAFKISHFSWRQKPEYFSESLGKGLSRKLLSFSKTPIHHRRPENDTTLWPMSALLQRKYWLRLWFRNDLDALSECKKRESTCMSRDTSTYPGLTMRTWFVRSMYVWVLIRTGMGLWVDRDVREFGFFGKFFRTELNSSWRGKKTGKVSFEFGRKESPE